VVGAPWPCLQGHVKRGTQHGSELRLNRLFAVFGFGQPLGFVGELIVDMGWTSGPVVRPVFRAGRTKELDGQEKCQYEQKKLTAPANDHVILSAIATPP
jgi:hypothetical protein